MLSLKKRHSYILSLVALILISCQSGGSCGTSNDIISTTDSKSIAISDTNPMIQEEFMLTLEKPRKDSLVVHEPKFIIQGQTRADALLTIDEDIVIPEADGKFMHELTLHLGHNVVEILSSTSAGEQKFLILSIIYAE